MNINTDINILGGLPDWELIYYFYEDTDKSNFTSIKTEKSVKRFKRAITNTLITFKDKRLELLFKSIIKNEGISDNLLLYLFWNASLNNDLFRYLNETIYFPALYSGRYSLKNDEIVACLKDLRGKEAELNKWTESTIKTTGSKYLTLLKKFGLLEGSNIKTLKHPFINDLMFVIFIYWLNIASDTPNLLKSSWLKYSFSEKGLLLERLKNKKYKDFFNIIFTGDNLNIETLIEYRAVYERFNRN